MFRLATLVVDIVTNKGNFDTSIMSMRGALGPLLGLTQRMTEQGSDLIETMNKVDVAFGGSSGMVTSFANEMAIQFGSVKNVTLDAASGFGLILQASGLTKEASAGLSIQLVRLADDMKSLYHIPLEDALRKIQAGLVGQARPLREYGVLLSATAVNQDLMAHGATRVHGQFSEQEKVMARLRIITEGLKVAQGDHAKTMDQYANQIDMLKGKMENYTTTIGAGAAGAQAKFMVNVVEKGIFSGLSEHAGEVWNQLFGDKNTSFQKGADIAAGLQVGLTKEMFANQTAPPEALDYGTEEIIAGLQEEKDMFDEIAASAKYAADNAREMEKILFFAEFASYDTTSPKQEAADKKKRKADAEAENKFMQEFLGLDIPGAKEQTFRSQSMGAADFASSLRMAQGGGDVPQKQLTELQALRKQEAESTKMLVDAFNKGNFAVLG